MKTIILLIIFGFMSLYGFSINPIDPPAKPADVMKTSIPESLVTTEECTDLLSLVDVTVIVTFTDCPDYDCGYPRDCTFNICIYSGFTLLGCQEFDLETCQYTFEGYRTEELTNITARLVLTSTPPCVSSYNTDPAYSNLIPIGGGTVSASTTFCP